MKRSIYSVPAVLALVAGTLLVASPAQAATSSCKAVGSNGTLCVTAVSNGFDASYTKTAGGTVTVDFNLRCSDGTWYGDDGSFAISKGQSRSYVFAIGKGRSCAAQILQGGVVQAQTGYVS
jgi:hypothetical protein